VVRWFSNNEEGPEGQEEWFLDNIESGWIVVDFGCNTGMLPFMLAEKAAFVYGIEINEEFSTRRRWELNIDLIRPIMLNIHLKALPKKWMRQGLE